MNQQEKRRKKHGEGCFDICKSDPLDIQFKDFRNIWTFTNLFRQDNSVVFQWLRDHNLLVDDLICPTCMDVCSLYKRSSKADGFTFRCKKGHEYGMRKYSFFEGSSFNIRDIIVFIKYYLECHTLLQCSKSANMDYKNTSVNWASYIRELFCEYVSTIYDYTEFEGEVELDESLFGRKVKYNRGNPSGLRIWIFGIVERSTNRIVLYPVDDRSANTLVPLIQKHVKPGSRIFSDSWAAYNTLNDIGYEHFSVVHKTSFKQKYVSTQTGEEVYCCTNRIEGAWKIAKDHFRAMNGTNTKMFEQHLCEIIWRNHHYRSDLYQSFFDLVNSVYTLDGPPKFNYQKPVFKTWTPPTKEDEKAHNITIVPDTEDELIEAPVEVTPSAQI